MILLNIYVATVIFAIISLVLLEIETKLYAREHNIVSAINKSKGRIVFNYFKLYIPCFVPLYNLFYGICSLCAVFNENIMKCAIEANIETGKLKYKDEGE